MIVMLQNVLTADQVAAIVAGLGDDAAAGAVHEDHGVAVGSALMEHEPFANAILPKALTPFQFDRHIPGSPVRDRMDSPLFRPGTPRAMRIDAVCVAFLSDPASYDGGELVIDSSTAPMPVKLPAGNAAVFPATDYFAVSPVTRGESWIASCGVQSAIRGTREREILTEMWLTLNDFEAMASGDNVGVKFLGKARSNLIRLLADS
jgi:PKHD-type hydroxylase